MFESIQQGLEGAFKTLSGKGRLTEGNMRDSLQLVQQALLEADVSYQVAKDFVSRVTEEAVGEKVLRSLKPGEHVIGLVHDELVKLMGPVDHSLHLQADVTLLMMCGLQGSGKTTTCGKLARLLRDRGKTPMLVAADLQRPAAIEQLHVLGQQLGVAVFSQPGATDPVAVCMAAVKEAKTNGANVVILDTAGRLHIDEELMLQLEQIDRRCSPHQVYLVVDGMTGQDAVNSAKAFNDRLELDGVIMTKLDGDARGGAVLSVKAVTGVPIKFIGVGEHLDALQEFHPERMAQRILGMGDVLTLVEQARDKFDEEEMKRQEEQLLKGQFTLDDFRRAMTQIRRLGPIKKLMGFIPGMGAMADVMKNVDADKDVTRMMGLIDSMTPNERRNPKIIDQSRRRRIAAGAGVQPHVVNELVKQFDAMAGMMTGMARLSSGDKMKEISKLQQGGFMNPGAQLSKSKGDTGKRLTSDERAQIKKQREKELRKQKREQRKK